MTKWIVRLIMGLITGLIGLYLQYQSMSGDAADGGGGDEAVVEGEEGQAPKEKQQVKGVPNSLMEQIQKGQSQGGRTRKGRRRD